MSNTLTQIAEQLKNRDKKIQLIYAFNGTGKTRLSLEFKKLVAPKNSDNEQVDDTSTRHKILYYNALTEDLFYWDHETHDMDPTLKIQPNSYTSWLLTLLKDLGQDGNITRYFQHYTHDKLTPYFSADFAEVRFFIQRNIINNKEKNPPIKISKGEESNFIWSIFYALLDQATTILNVAEAAERETPQFDQLQYVFIDDPVSSLDENHLIELAVDLAGLIKASPKQLKFIITTHNALFYNILFNELNNKTYYTLERQDDGTFCLEEKDGDSNTSFSYHLYLKHILETAIEENRIERYHFMLIRNLYERTANFLGYRQWGALLPGDKKAYYKRIIQFTSHHNISYERPAQPQGTEKQTVKFLLDHLLNHYQFNQGEKQHESPQ